MAQAFELTSGELIVPRTIFDMMDIVEDRLGVEARQYIEAYLEDGDDSIFEDDGFDRQLLDDIDDMASEIETLLAGNRLCRKKIFEKVERIRSRINRERKTDGKESI